MSVEPKSSTKEIPIQEPEEAWNSIKKKVKSNPTMVFSVIGDSDSFVPRPWPTTLFQTALIEAAKSGGETWILFRKNEELVSNVILEAYQHYEAMEFGRDKDDTHIKNPNKHIKLINISGRKTDSTKSNCKVCGINIGEEENQLLNFEMHILDKEVSFFNPESKINMPVPIAIIVCEGDLRTVVHIAKALGTNIPVIIMKGSGKAADLVLDYIEKNDELRKKASISFGIQFDNEKYELLEKHLGEIVTHKNL